MKLDLLLISVPLGAALANGLWLILLRNERRYSDPRIAAHLADISTTAAVVRAGSGGSALDFKSFWMLFSGVHINSRKLRNGKFHQLSQVADFLELLQMSLAAGQSMDQAILRLSTVSGSAFGREIRICAEQLNLGMPLAEALNLLAKRIPILEGPVRQLEVSVMRGTPVVSVLADTASDLRSKLRERLIEEGGKKEISMMIPLVFGIMPLSVLFAVYPGLSMLSNGF